jgi:SAM-dependent methyltransferase
VGRLVNIITPLHTRTNRDYIGRMVDQKVHCSVVAREYGEAFWDGDRRYGYGGYHYDGRWAPVARRLVDEYGLKPDVRILDAGCGKAHLLYELALLLPDAMVVGFDISEYAIATSPPEIRERLFKHKVEDPWPFADNDFDLVISLMALHNLPLPQLADALREMERVGRSKYLAVESYRTVQELFNLQCWALTCESFLRPEEWRWMFDTVHYTGDFEFAFFE